MKWLRTPVLALAALAALVPVAHAETVRFATALSGQNESPPNGSTATGQAEATFDTDTGTLSWTVEFAGLSGPPIGAHIHGPADPGGNAGIMVPFKTLESPIAGEAKLNATQAEALRAGKLYVNIHTDKYPGGELRGQLIRR